MLALAEPISAIYRDRSLIGCPDSDRVVVLPWLPFGCLTFLGP